MMESQARKRIVTQSDSTSSFWFVTGMFCLVLALCGSFYLYETRRFQSALMTRENTRLEAFARLINHDVRNVANDLRELANGEGVDAYINSNQQIDLQKAARHAVFYSKLKPHYDQVRILDEHGNEIVRINHHGQIVPPDQLQNKADRDYFKITRKLSPGQLYVSPYDLNMESGEIERPFKSVLRFAAPLFDNAGQFRGIYVINYLGGSLFLDIDKLYPHVEHRLRMLNARGFWLKAAQPEQEWGFIFPDRRDETMAISNPSLWAKVSAHPSGQSRHAGRILSWHKLDLSHIAGNDANVASPADSSFFIASEVTPEELGSLLAPLRLIFGIITAIMMLLVIFAQRLIRSRRQALRELSQSEQNLAVTFDSIGDAVLTTDIQGNVTRMNPIAENLTGWLSVEALGKPVTDVFNIINEQTRKPAAVPVDDVLATGEIQGLANHTVIIARNGKERPIADSAAPIRSPEGEILGVVLVFRDVSQEQASKQALRLSEARYHALFETMDEGFCIVEVLFDEQDKALDYRFLETNPAFKNLTGLFDVIGKTMLELAPNHEAYWFELMGKVALTGEASRYQNRAEELGRTYDVYVFRFGDADKRQVAILFNDITERKYFEEQMIAARNAAENANLAKSEFLAMMSHELRTPLNGILGMNDLLRQTELTERQRRFVEACSTSGKALLQQINDVLDLSKIEAGKLELDLLPCNLESLVYDIVDMFASQAQQKNLLLKCHMEPSSCVTVLADEHRLRQVLLNLISNALKYTEEGSVEIRADVRHRDNSKLTIWFSVTDTGIGMAEELHYRLFLPFTQVNNIAARKQGGTGLGLSVSKQLIELMGGRIGFESSVGKGSSFWFELPFYLAEETDKPIHKQPLLGTRVLAVDGIDKERCQIGECLRAWGCKALQVSTVQEALDAVCQAEEVATPFTVVLADCRLAVGDEYVLLTQLAQRPHLHIIGMGGNDDETSVSYLRQLGVRHILHDPARPSALFNAMSSVLSITNIPSLPTTGPEMKTHQAQPKLNSHILVVEDNRINQMYVVELLKSCGCTYDLATNGIQAVEHVKQNQYDAVLMDCQMPEMDGFAASAEIRRWESEQTPPRHIPIVALTANALQGDRNRCLEAGMDDYLSKPLAVDQLIAVLQKYLAS